MTSDKKILVCTNFRANPNTPSCSAKGSNTLLAKLSDVCIKKKWSISVEQSPCMGMCHQGPNVRLAPNGKFFHVASTAKALPVLVEEIEAFITY